MNTVAGLVKIAAATAALGLSACSGEQTAGVAETPGAEAAAGPVAAAVASAARTPEQVERDQWRHPVETLEFFDVQPGDTVVELFPGAGWYTEILGPLLKHGGGRLVAVIPDPEASDYYRQAADAYRAAYVDRVETYGDITITPFVSDGAFGPEGSADKVLTFRNVHNWMAAGYADRMFENAFNVLKPGGVLGVVEHRLPSAWDQDLSARTGYVHEAYVIQLAERAGFELEAESEINANPNDPADHLLGVWMLPPRLLAPEEGSTLAADYDPQRYIDIGESDRMTLKFRKPLAAAGDQMETTDEAEGETE